MSGHLTLLCTRCDDKIGLCLGTDMATFAKEAIITEQVHA